MEDILSHSVSYSVIQIVLVFDIIDQEHSFCSGHFISGSGSQYKSLPLARMVCGSSSSGLCSCGGVTLQRNSTICSAKALQDMFMCKRNEIVCAAEQQVAHSSDCIHIALCGEVFNNMPMYAVTAA